MKNTSAYFRLLVLAVLTAGGIQVQAEDKTAAEPGQPQSIFTVPASLKDGRDPFFPESTRMVEVAPSNIHAVEISSLRYLGLSGTAGHLLAIINNHTFAVGEEGDVKTAYGALHLRCMDIQPGSVMVEVNGQTHRINLQSQ
jgi:hypothetical protein